MFQRVENSIWWKINDVSLLIYENENIFYQRQIFFSDENTNNYQTLLIKM